MSFPTYSNPNLFFNFDLPVLLDHVILFGRLRLGLGITSRIEDIEDIFFHQRHRIQEIEPWRWRLKTIYAPCCSSIIFLAEQQVSWKGIPEGIKVGWVVGGRSSSLRPLHLELHGYVPDSSLSLEHLMLKTQNHGKDLVQCVKAWPIPTPCACENEWMCVWKKKWRARPLRIG